MRCACAAWARSRTRCSRSAGSTAGACSEGKRPMQSRPVGRSGLSTAPLVLGGNVFGWTVDELTAYGLLDAFVDGGFNLIDTADMYSTWVEGHVGGESEAIIGRWLKRSGKRDRVLIATKVG